MFRHPPTPAPVNDNGENAEIVEVIKCANCQSAQLMAVVKEGLVYFRCMICRADLTAPIFHLMMEHDHAGS